MMHGVAHTACNATIATPFHMLLLCAAQTCPERAARVAPRVFGSMLYMSCKLRAYGHQESELSQTYMSKPLQSGMALHLAATVAIPPHCNSTMECVGQILLVSSCWWQLPGPFSITQMQLKTLHLWSGECRCMAGECHCISMAAHGTRHCLNC